MVKVAYNSCYGGFGLSDAAVRRYAEIKGITLYPEPSGYSLITYWTVPPEERGVVLSSEDFYKASEEARRASNEFYRANQIYGRDIERTDPVLIQVIEELGDKANGQCAKLAITELAAGTQYRIDEYDGYETVETRESYDWKVA